MLPVTQVELSATAVWPGLDGLLLLLSALARQPLHCCWAHMLPVVCGAQAAFVASPTTHTADTLAMMVVAQLMPDNTTTSAPAAAGAGDVSSNDSKEASNDDSKSEQQREAAAAAPAAPALRCVVQIVVRASSHEVLMAIKHQPETWVNDISQVGMISFSSFHEAVCGV